MIYFSIVIVIRPTCRIQFTKQDVDFIVETLCGSQSQRDSVMHLLADPDTCDQILDQQKLFDTVVRKRGCVRISSRLYFYLLVRHVMLDAGISDSDTADYVAEMLTVFSRTQRMHHPLNSDKQSLHYLVDIMTAMEAMDEQGKFVLRTHMANFSLFLSGVFPQYVTSRCKRKAAPPLAYYENIGRSSYRCAGHHRLAEKYELSDIFYTLADTFNVTRVALNDMAERLVFLHDPEPFPNV